MRTTDVVVVGGGVIGCACAHALAAEGLRVVLLEREGLASQASGAAAGMLLPVGEAEAAGPLLHWGLRALAAYPAWAEELRARSGIDPEWVESGALHLALREEEAPALAARAGALPGVEVEWLDAASARAAQPGLASELCGALWSPREAHVRSPLLARALAGAASRLGAAVEIGARVTGWLRAGDRVIGVRGSGGDLSAGSVVLCAGAWAGEAARWLDPPLQLPVEPLRGQIASLESPRPALGSIVVHGARYLVPKRDGSLVVGATEERAGFDRRVTASGLASLLRAAARLVPALGDASFHAVWSGLRPVTPDRLPLVGPLRSRPGLHVAVGHGRNGVLLAPVTAALVRDAVLGKGLPPEAEALRPERFSEA